MLRESLSNTVSNRRGTFGASVGQDDCKLVTTKPGDNVGFSGAAPDHRGSFDERQASRLVPVCIVDSLETVEVQKNER